MNFKPTLWKSIVSIVIGLAVWIYTEGGVTCGGGVACPIFHESPIIVGILIAVIIYIIWSLFQRGKK